MYRSMKAALVITCTAAVAAPGDARRAGVSNDECAVFRILPDGRQVRAKSTDVDVASRGHSSASSRSVSVRSRSGNSRSSASAFSSSSSGSRGSARAVSSVTDEDGRTITTTHDEKGCRVVIDER